MCLELISTAMVAVMSASVGFFLPLFLFAWEDERSDRYAGITWKRTLEGCVASEQPYGVHERMPWT